MAAWIRRISAITLCGAPSKRWHSRYGVLYVYACAPSQIDEIRTVTSMVQGDNAVHVFSTTQASDRHQRAALGPIGAFRLSLGKAGQLISVDTHEQHLEAFTQAQPDYFTNPSKS